MEPLTGTWQDCLLYVALSDQGLRRANNQDSLAVMIAPSEAAWRQKGHLVMVADGMGAHAAGELASKLATDTVPLVYHKLNDHSPPEAILAAVQEANSQIHNRGQGSLEFRGMGTTSTVLLLLPQGAVLAHVGDSRAYRLRGNRLEQLTFDHSLVWEMRVSGQLPKGVVPDYIPKNVITRSLGPNAAVHVDLEGPFPIAQGDVYLLCSDGLSGQVKDEEIGIILGCLPLPDAVRALVDLANLRGGPDNITIVAATVTGPLMAAGGTTDSGFASAKDHSFSIYVSLWILAAVLAFAGAGLFGLGHLAAGLLSLALAGVAGAAAWLARPSRRPSTVHLDGRALGRGPYTAATCAPSIGFVHGLADLVRELREAAGRDKWAVDWSRFNGHLQRATAATQTADYPQAVQHYCQAISFMMAQLKQQGKSDGSVSP